MRPLNLFLSHYHKVHKNGKFVSLRKKMKGLKQFVCQCCCPSQFRAKLLSTRITAVNGAVMINGTIVNGSQPMDTFID